ncbi:Synaptic vesicle membrane protein VAT 1 [Fasciola hepatica]|uniref:Synaptic vesicle membrane protein VAT 1 n=1 Tax=Fasciola hepatica TaxID=6192 RepID=A0A4E0RL95_FASHE|nr:Synaptic vesicle membrane protein VAT 1 [Fasciola hepatica]
MTETEKTPTAQAESTGSETKPAASTEQEAAEATKEGKTEATPQEKPALPQYRSIVLGSFGGSKHLRTELTDQRKPERNEIEVEVEACGVNFLDIMVRQGLIDHPMKPPFTMGSECAGKVIAVGEDVKQYKVGDLVVVLRENGAWAERLYVPVIEATASEDANATSPGTTSHNHGTETVCVLPWPKGLSASKSSILAFAYLPAYFLLHQVANIQSGDVILVHSAGGGVGTAVGQLAKQIPNVKLIGTASKGKHEALSELYDVLYTPDEDKVTEIKKLHPEGISVILDCLSGEEISKSYSLLKPLGKYILYGMSNLVTGDRKNLLSLAKHWFHVERINPLRLHEDNHMLGGFSLKSLLFPRTSGPARQHDLVRSVWAELIKLIDAKKIDPLVDSEWSFEEIKEAMMRLQERKNVGKVVLLPKAKPRTKKEETDDAKETHGKQKQNTNATATSQQ